MPLFRYYVHGLVVESDLPLAGLPGGEGPADVVVRAADVRARASNPVQAGCFEADPDRLFYLVPGVALLLAQNGRELLVEREDIGDDRAFRAAIVGQGLASVLHQRGVLALHASAVAVGEGAVAFVGEPGQGKSTTAAAFIRRGHALLTDDVLAVEVGAEGAVAHPAASWVKLRDDAAAVWAPDTAVPTGPGVAPKHVWDLPAEAVASRPLLGLFELAFGDALRMDRCPPQRALTTLAAHTYVRDLVRSPADRVRYLAPTAALVRAVPVWRLTRPRSLEGVETVLDRVVETVTANR